MKKIVYIGLLSALLCVLAPLSLNINVIPFSLATLVIMLYGEVFSFKISFTSVLIYVMLGIVGLPVFSGYGAGMAKILSPSGGFILGYMPLVAIISILNKNKTNKVYKFIILLLSNIVLYIIGTVYYSILTKNSFISGLAVCMIPFIIPDIIKMLIVLLIEDKIKVIINDKELTN